MGRKEDIKQRIYQLEGGRFQCLCNSYLYNLGYRGMVALGSDAETQKTTAGTPDTYFMDSDGRYILVEYTTKKDGLYNKIKSDLTKCLDVDLTRISHDKISKIIYCHTSSNLNTMQNDELHDLCNNYGIPLLMIGIDQLAEDIYQKYEYLARDYLDLTISTGQVQHVADFVKNYSSSETLGSLSIEFMFREEEIRRIKELFNDTDIVILSGYAGVGKTKLALHYIQNYVNVPFDNRYCIRDLGLSIHEDIKTIFTGSESYFLLLDDADKISALKFILDYTIKSCHAFKVKILLTVRNHELRKVEEAVREFTSCRSIEICPFTDNEIEKLIETTYDIKNNGYKEKIVELANGNCRIAILAGKIVKESGRVDAIGEVSKLYKHLYGKILDETMLSRNEKLCIAASLVVFLGKFNIDHIDKFNSILKLAQLEKKQFWELIQILYEKNVVEIYKGKGVVFLDNCFGNYLLKYVFYDKKYIELKKFILEAYFHFKPQTMDFINVLCTTFYNDDMVNFIESVIKEIMVILEQEQPPLYWEFLQSFFLVTPTKTLSHIQQKIDSISPVTYEWDEINSTMKKNYESPNDYILNILGNFVDNEDFTTACDLYFYYYSKKPDLYEEFYKTAKVYFTISRYSYRYDYSSQVVFLEKMIKSSGEWENRNVAILFLELAIEFLKYTTHDWKQISDKEVALYIVNPRCSKGAKQYRSLIWKNLLKLCHIDAYKSKVKKILFSYSVNGDYIDIALLRLDLRCIKIICQKYFPPNCLDNCILMDKFITLAVKNRLINLDQAEKVYSIDKLNIYRILRGKLYYECHSYRDKEKYKKNEIATLVKDKGIFALKQIIDLLSTAQNYELYSVITFDLSNGVCMAFDSIVHCEKQYIESIKYYLEKNTPFGLSPDYFLPYLFDIATDDCIYNMIANTEFLAKNNWLLSYYSNIPVKLITNDHLVKLWRFLDKISQDDNPKISFIDIDSFEKYSHIDDLIFIKICQHFYNNLRKGSKFAKIVFDYLFKKYLDKSDELIKKFHSDLSLLEDIYLLCIEDKMDIDFTGRILKDLYLAKPEILDRYIMNMMNSKMDLYDKENRLFIFYSLDNYAEVYIRIFNCIIDLFDIHKQNLYSIEGDFICKSKDENLTDKQDTWIKKYIDQYSSDSKKMYCLFYFIASLDSNRKLKFYLQFIQLNTSFDAFKNIPLLPIGYSYVNTVVPIYDEWVKFLSNFESNLEGICYLKHKAFVNEELEKMKENLEDADVNEKFPVM